MSSNNGVSEAHACSPDQLMRFSLLTSPSMIYPTIILLEALRTIPGELRMIIRMLRRKRPNIAELLFFHLKYLAIFAVIGHLLIQYTKGWLDARGCWVWHWISTLCIFFCSSLVSLTLAFRCYIIFECNKTIGAALLVFVAVQLAASMALAAAMDKYNALNEPGGYCVWRDTNVTAPPAFQFNFYYIASCVCDLMMITLSGWKLIRLGSSSLWPFRMFKTSRLLFRHNVHYVATVCLVNVTQLILSWTADIPDTLLLAISIQVCVGLQQLQAEQDAVHGHQDFRPMTAESKGRKGGGDGGAVSGIGGGKAQVYKHTGSAATVEAGVKERQEVDKSIGVGRGGHNEVHRFRPSTAPQQTRWSKSTLMDGQVPQSQRYSASLRKANGSSIAESSASAHSGGLNGLLGTGAQSISGTSRSPSALRTAYFNNNSQAGVNHPRDTPRDPHRVDTAAADWSSEMVLSAHPCTPRLEVYSIDQDQRCHKVSGLVVVDSADSQIGVRPTKSRESRVGRSCTLSHLEPDTMDHYDDPYEASEVVNDFISAYTLAKQRRVTSGGEGTETA